MGGGSTCLTCTKEVVRFQGRTVSRSRLTDLASLFIAPSVRFGADEGIDGLVHLDSGRWDKREETDGHFRTLSGVVSRDPVLLVHFFVPFLSYNEEVGILS